ncbi:hypothetical protein HGB13_05220, partial [bacterium]|nr:hypothetical protein [bacterium]
WTMAVIFILFLSDNPDFLYSQFTGAIGGFLPDIVLLPLVKTKLGTWHVKRQSHGQKVKDALVEVSLIVASLLILIFWR